MMEHGITTTTADCWIHFHPIEVRNDNPCPCVYLYSVAHCREYIVRQKLALISARSKDAGRSVTASGYLVPKASFFITRQLVPIQYAGAHRWADATDREAGVFGERCVQLMVFKREIWLPERQLKPLNNRADQFNGCDCELVVMPALRFEIKTECAISDNLFVQKEEQGHQVHFTSNGTRRESSFMDGFEDRA